MNSFGRLFRVNIFGESHGESVGVNIDGCPAGIPLPLEDFLPDLERRKGGMQKGTTPRKEEDLPIFKRGLFRQAGAGEFAGAAGAGAEGAASAAGAGAEEPAGAT